ncbi:MAG: ABC transporter permease subunit [Phycisphaerales bacterium]|nr:MAG: ABC transporter permease subunit [Phycisphaerales bacterium]
MSLTRLDEIRQESTRDMERLNAEYSRVLGEIETIRGEDAKVRISIRDVASGQIAPMRQGSTEPMLLSQVVRIVPANSMTLGERLGLYVSRWWEYVSSEPRFANQEGGIFPVIVGTVLLTVLLCIVVVPLGVIAALYLREYAKQGPLVSLVRIGINNLAGVPSIVYGVFGLGFFCYLVGGYVDAGPAGSGLTAMPRAPWWVLVVAIVAILGVGTWLLNAARASVLSGGDAKSKRVMRLVAGGAWTAAAVGVVLLVARTPYFTGLFAERLPAPTFGSKGLLWAALTLALLTLPVVIVATEEAIAAVPRSVREGSYGCGASKWQTIHRVVLPQAMPGILTGAILAMARGAGEVAPLMLVGAMKLAPEPPINAEFPYVHMERSFMHLGFHIYDLGFQSPDSEAARPMVWTTTLVLLVIVMILNLSAILLRARLRAGARGASV